MMIQWLSDGVIPLIVVIIVLWGMKKGVAVYDEFIKGAKDGLGVAVQILPTLVGLMIAVGVLRASGLLDRLVQSIAFLTDALHFPAALVPLGVLKLFSSSAATGMLLDIYETYGCDSFLGTAASLMLSSTETVFYTMSIYFMSVKITKTRWTLAGALLCSLAGIGMSVWLASL